MNDVLKPDTPPRTKCEVSGHRSLDVPRLFAFWGVDVSGHRSLFVCGCVGSSFPFFCVWGSCFWLVVFGRVDCVFGDDFSGCFVDCDGVGSGAAWGRGVAGMRRLATVEFDFGARLYPKEPKTVARVTI